MYFCGKVTRFETEAESLINNLSGDFNNLTQTKFLFEK